MDLAWLVGQCISAVTLHEGLSWTLAFDAKGMLRVGCLWRILEKGRIILTSEDHGQWFGLPAPVNANEKAIELLGGDLIAKAAVCEGTLDIIIDFVHGRRLEILPNSSGYESWELTDPFKTLTVAQGGGNLVTLKL